MKALFALMLALFLASAGYGQLSGPLSGTLGPGTYHIVGQIWVPPSTTLQMNPGTVFTFDGAYSFEIYGSLLAEGVEGDSILFTTDTLANPNRWRGLRFFSGSSLSRLAYCAIRHGGGVDCYDSSPAFTNCTLSGNSVVYNGGGVDCYASSSSFTNCTISGNSASYGGGVYCYASSSSFTNCTISGNSAYMYGGGGVFCENSSPTFTNCTISGNLASTNGGGVFCDNSSSPHLKNSIIAFSHGAGIYFSGSPAGQVEYCDIFGNSGGDIIGGPAGIGRLVTTNANGDSADIYLNIFLNPLFANLAFGDFHLTDRSRCIGAGDAENCPPFDADGNPRPNPPGSNPDIGAYEHSASGPLRANPMRVTLAREFALYQNYPNPFNSATRIGFDLAKSGAVELSVFNIMGQRVVTVVNGMMTAGRHDLRFDAGTLSSGMYLYRLEGAGFEAERKMVVLK